jgi:hypothetical protein
MVGLTAAGGWLPVEAAATVLGIAARPARARPASANRALDVPDFSGVRMGVSFRWRGELSQALAGEPGQGEAGDFAPSVIQDEGVAAVRECVVAGDRA